MDTKTPFDGYKELIKSPLEKKDPLSFNRITRLIGEIVPGESETLSIIIQRLCGKTLKGREAIVFWRHVLEHKLDIEAKLGRVVGIQPAILDYNELICNAKRHIKLTAAEPAIPAADSEWMRRIYNPGYCLEKMKEEMLRSKRYKHALSTILLDVDEFHLINESYSFKTGDEVLSLIIKIIQAAIRTVDILTRFSGDRFLVILPNTNRREAMELAARLCKNIQIKTKNVSGLASGVTATLAVGQYNISKSCSTPEYIKQLEAVLSAGKQKQRNAVYGTE